MFLISEKGQPFSLIQNSEAAKVKTDKIWLHRIKISAISTNAINGQTTKKIAHSTEKGLISLRGFPQIKKKMTA